MAQHPQIVTIGSIGSILLGMSEVPVGTIGLMPTRLGPEGPLKRSYGAPSKGFFGVDLRQL